jgi:uncharacterized membrane protein YphA (DoxX/SURF4 family)
MELKFGILDAPRSRFDLLKTWLIRIIAAMLYLSVGWSKFSPRSQWVRIFAQIGFGQWFRYVTGILQVGGALMVLIPRLVPVGIVILVCTMVGAMTAWIFILGAPLNAMIPGALAMGLLAVGGEDLVDFVYRRKRKF